MPLLTAAEEVELAKRIERGDHSAKQAMVEADLRLVVSIAKRYRNQASRSSTSSRRPRSARPGRREVRLPQGLQVLDLCHVVDQAGGARARSPTRRARSGCRCTSSRSSARSSAAALAARQLGREPSSIEIAVELDLNAEEVEQIRRSAQTPVSLEKPVGDEDESGFGHFLSDATAPLPDELAEEAMRKESLKAILGTLSHRETARARAAIWARWGSSRGLDEVGRTFNVTRSP